MGDLLDVIVIGAGPAGLTASIYCSCFHLSHVVVGKVMGGQMAVSPDILNYPGFIEITGKELTERMVAQVQARGGTIITESVVGIEKQENLFLVRTETKKTYKAKAIILASGTERKKLNVPGESQYTGKGVLYCTTCERHDYEGKDVVVVGGGNAATQSAVQLAHRAKTVTILHRGSELRCEGVWLERMKEYPNISVLYTTKVVEILGDGQKVIGVKIVTGQEEKTLAVEKVFVEIGGVPGTVLAANLGVYMDQGGFIAVDEKLQTNVEGVFAAGDLVSYGLSIEQISTAVGLGARAAASAFSYIKQQKPPTSWGKTLIKR